MKRCFVLVDQSVKRPGGHHYEYAKRILDAAKAQGFETILLANKHYRGLVNHDVRPTFSLTFWDNYQHYYGGAQRAAAPKIFRSLAKTVNAFRTGFLNWERRLVYSRLGLALGRARHITLWSIMLDPRLPQDGSSTRNSRATLAVARLAFISAASLSRFFGVIQRNLPPWTIKLLSRMLLIPFALLFGGAFAAAMVGRVNPGVRFGQELKSSMRGRDCNNCIVFVPNATGAELDGFSNLWEASVAISRAQWAFLYRRPIFQGYPESYNGQMEAARFHRVEFNRLRERASDARVQFYTDTDELTAQYNLLGIYAFKTLPVPVEIVANVPQNLERPMVFGYLGDARDEKGFHLLPRIVDGLTRREKDENGPKFLFQSNFNTPEGEPLTRYAHGILAQKHDSQIELAPGPFESGEYGKLLRRMDIVLIPYSVDSYLVRSSGVLVEAISSGLPVLAPATTWMSRIAEPARRQHLEKTFLKRKAVARIATPYDELNDKTLLIDDTANYVSVRIEVADGYQGFVRVVICSISKFHLALETRQMAFKAENGQVYAAFDKPLSSLLWFKAEPVTVDERMPLRNVELSLYVLDEPVPLDSGIVLFDGDDDVVRAARSLLEFYPHHKRAAEALRDDIRPLYDPAVLVETLDRDSFSERVTHSERSDVR